MLKGLMGLASGHRVRPWQELDIEVWWGRSSALCKWSLSSRRCRLAWVFAGFWVLGQVTMACGRLWADLGVITSGLRDRLLEREARLKLASGQQSSCMSEACKWAARLCKRAMHEASWRQIRNGPRWFGPRGCYFIGLIWAQNWACWWACKLSLKIGP